MTFFVYLFISCHSNRTEFNVEIAALEEYRLFIDARENKEWDKAEAHIKSAMQLQPNSISLKNWHVRLMLDKEDYQSCINYASSYLGKRPGDKTLRYNKAVCLSQNGDLDAAAKTLRYLVVDGRVHPIELAEDSDFRPLLEEGRYSDVIRYPKISVDIEVQPESAILNQPTEYAINVHYRSNRDLELVVSDSLEWTVSRVIEDQQDGDSMMAVRRLKFDIRPLKAGVIKLNSWTIKSESESIPLPEFEMEAFELDNTSQQFTPMPPYLPSKYLLSRSLPFSNVITEEGRPPMVLLAGPPNAELKHGQMMYQELEYRIDGVILAKAVVFPLKEKLTLTVTLEEDVLLQEVIEPE